MRLFTAHPTLWRHITAWRLAWNALELELTAQALVKTLGLTDIVDERLINSR